MSGICNQINDNQNGVIMPYGMTTPFFMSVLTDIPEQGYRTFCVFFNANGASVYRASLAFIFSEMIFEGGQKVL